MKNERQKLLDHMDRNKTLFMVDGKPFLDVTGWDEHLVNEMMALDDEGRLRFKEAWMADDNEEDIIIEV
jgi:hypothetical protein